MEYGYGIDAFGDPSVIRRFEIARTPPGPGEVTVRQEAIGFNFVDTMFRGGLFGGDLPMILGSEAAGVVAAVGPGVDHYLVGDRVAYFYAPGADVSLRNVAASALVRVPDDVPLGAVATFLGKGMTAWMALLLFQRVVASDVLLIHGATGGAGSITARWARHLGATVIGTTRSAARLGVLDGTVDHAIALDAEDPLCAINAVSRGGVDIVIDFVGGGTIPLSVAALRQLGLLAQVGAAAGSAEPDAHALSIKRLRVAGGSTVRNVSGPLVREATRDLFDAIRQGAFKGLPIVRLPLDEVARAHDAAHDIGLGGPVVLLP